jgi:threonine synthase
VSGVTDHGQPSSGREATITDAQPREYPSFVTHLECSDTGVRYEADVVQGLSDVGKPLLVKYDMERLSSAVTKEEIALRPGGMWRYREFLPVRRSEDVVSLGETETPLVPLLRMSELLGVAEIMVKDEGRLPTGSFKARGIALAVSMAKELGMTRLAMPTNGNAGAALAAYGTRAGMETYIFCPDNTPEINVREIALQGGKVWKVNGLINDCGKIVGAGREPMGWFDVSTLKEPYRIEGKKTMGLELADQMDWQLPDVIFYPTGGGTGLIGMWKAFNELKEIGWLTGVLPRMVAVQSTGCAPIVRAFDDGVRHAQPWENAETIASGIRVPGAIGDFLILDAVRESGGFAIAVPDGDIEAAQVEVAALDGLLLCPEGAATFAAYRSALESGLVSKDERAALFNCGNGLKYPMPPVERILDHTAPIDWDALARA